MGAVALATVALAVTACGGSSGSGSGGSTNTNVNSDLQNQAADFMHLDLAKLSPTVKAPSSNTTITFQSWIPLNQGNKTLQKLADQFHQIHPNITVKFQSVPADSAQTSSRRRSPAATRPTRPTSTTARSAPSPRAARWSTSSDYISKRKAVTPDDYVPAFKAWSTYERQMYGLPIDGESTALFYRTDLFKKRRHRPSRRRRGTSCRPTPQKLTDPGQEAVRLSRSSRPG